MEELKIEKATGLKDNPISQIFRHCLDSYHKPDEWFKDINRMYDLFDRAARLYTKKIKLQSGTMLFFGITERVPLKSNFIPMHLYVKQTPKKAKSAEEIPDIIRGIDEGGQLKPSIEVIDDIQKIMLLGEPGSGKSTFLKFVALNAAEGKLAENYVPILINLRKYFNSKMIFKDYISSQFQNLKIPDQKAFIDWILQKGKCIILIDGIDELHDKKYEQAIDTLRNFASRYRKNKFVIECRTSNYNHAFEDFVSVEMPGFNNEQIRHFIYKWFGKGTKKSELCLQKLFEYKPLIHLASNPLQLTMLCQVYHDACDFPANKTELYREAFAGLLKRWRLRDKKEYDMFRRLSLKRKQSLFAHIAFSAFENEYYRSPQVAIEKILTEFFQHLPDANLENLDNEPRGILQVIERQYGFLKMGLDQFYYFPYLNFQEYLTATYFIKDISISELVGKSQNLYDRKWRQVLLFIVEMLERADEFLLRMKFHIDASISKRVSRFFKTLEKEIVKKDTPYSSMECKILAVFYVIAIDIVRIRDRERRTNIQVDNVLTNVKEHARASKRLAELVRCINSDRKRLDLLKHVLYVLRDFAQSLDIDLQKPIFHVHALVQTIDFHFVHIHKKILDVDRVLARALEQKSDQDRVRKLTPAIDRIRELSRDFKRLRDLDRDKSRDFNQRLDCHFDLNKALHLQRMRTVDRTFNRVLAMNSELDLDLENLTLLKDYIYACTLLIDCLKTDCYVTRQNRQLIIDGLLS